MIVVKALPNYGGLAEMVQHRDSVGWSYRMLHVQVLQDHYCLDFFLHEAGYYLFYDIIQ